jgi:hypothetical protein
VSEDLDDAARAIIDPNLYTQFVLDENEERVPVELRSG